MSDLGQISPVLVKLWGTLQGWIQDFKLGGGALKKIAPSRGRRENFRGISCEKSLFYAKKSYFFPILGGGARRVRPPPPPDRPCLARRALKEADPIGLPAL
jgi:hypothetical protein